MPVTLADRHDVQLGRGIATGVQCQDGTAAKRYREEGFQMMTVGSDHLRLRQAARVELEAAVAA
jgi:hypothetical protein